MNVDTRRIDPAKGLATSKHAVHKQAMDDHIFSVVQPSLVQQHNDSAFRFPLKEEKRLVG